MQASDASRRENEDLRPMLDAVIASKAKQSISRPKEGIVGWVERSDTHRLATGIDGYRFAPPILRATCYPCCLERESP